MGQILCGDCGFAATGRDEDEMVSAVQAHARDGHDMELPRALALALARSPAHEGDGPSAG